MCKIFVMTNMKKVEDTQEAVNVINDHITKDDKDGFGYAIQGKEGLYGERTTSPRGFEFSFYRAVPDVPFIRPLGYNRFGQWTENVGAGIFHGRFSTNSKDLINVHPINKNGWSLIHNGVVSNTGPDYPMITQNDTEHLVHYISTTGVKGIEQNLTGYYAIAAFDPIGQLHILRDAIAPLCFAHLPDLDSYVFGTNKALIQSICDDLGWECSIIADVSDNVYLIYNDNKLVHSSYIKSRGWTNKESSLSGLSLGYDLGNSRDVDEESVMFEDWSEKKAKYKSKKNSKPDNYTNEEIDLLEEGFSPDEIKGLQEIYACADHSYQFLDYRKDSMTFEEFMALEDNEKLYCTVIRSDGTVLDWVDYDRERLWEGAV